MADRKKEPKKFHEGVGTGEGGQGLCDKSYGAFVQKIPGKALEGRKKNCDQQQEPWGEARGKRKEIVVGSLYHSKNVCNKTRIKSGRWERGLPILT